MYPWRSLEPKSNLGAMLVAPCHMQLIKNCLILLQSCGAIFPWFELQIFFLWLLVKKVSSGSTQKTLAPTGSEKKLVKICSPDFDIKKFEESKFYYKALMSLDFVPKMGKTLIKNLFTKNFLFFFSFIFDCR